MKRKRYRIIWKDLDDSRPMLPDSFWKQFYCNPVNSDKEHFIVEYKIKPVYV